MVRKKFTMKYCTNKKIDKRQYLVKILPFCLISNYTNHQLKNVYKINSKFAYMILTQIFYFHF